MYSRNAANRYRSIQVKTAAPGKVLVMLYDGLIRFLGEAKTAIGEGDRARAGERLDRSHRIVSELLCCLKPEHAPELCEQLESVYNFSLDRIVRANLEWDEALIDEALNVLEPLRQAWRQAAEEWVAA